MSASLDLDDVAATSPLAKQELRALRLRADRPGGWVRADERLPDDDRTVLIALSDGEPLPTRGVWTGYYDGDCWRFVSGDMVGEFNERDGSDERVTHWMDFPEPPR